MKHTLDREFLTHRIGVDVVGAGGNGSQMLTGLARLHFSMRALGHPEGLHVTAHDPDTVTEANVGRQLFSPSDIGQFKANVLVHRINAYYGLDWDSNPAEFSFQHSRHHPRILIGCVDTKRARRFIHEGLRGRAYPYRYWLDLGNEAKTGQVILGEPGKSDPKQMRLPMVTDLFREILDPKAKEDDTPSCSLAGALERQDLFINQMVATLALNLLWSLLRNGGLDHHGYFANLETGVVAPLPVDPDGWERFGFYYRNLPPLRKIKKVIRAPGPMRRGLFKLECGHDQSGYGRTRARCVQCHQEGRK